MFKFEILEIWKKSMNLYLNISKLLFTFPTHERYALSDQLRRATLSISTNIAEGCGSETEKDFNRYLSYSIKSTYEVVSLIIVARKMQYLSTKDFKKLYSELDYLIKQIKTFKQCKKVRG